MSLKLIAWNWCLVPLAALFVASGSPPVHAQNHYQDCVRRVSGQFQQCLRNDPTRAHCTRYAVCAASWKEARDMCWTSYRMHLANRRSIVTPSPYYSRGPLRGDLCANFSPYRRSPSADPSTRRSYTTTPSYRINPYRSYRRY